MSKEPEKVEIPEPKNHLWVKSEEDALRIIKSPNQVVYYVIRYWSPTCEACVKTNPAFMAIAKNYTDIAFFTVEAKDVSVAKFFSLVRGTPSFAVGSKYAGQIDFVEGADLATLTQILNQT